MGILSKLTISLTIILYIFIGFTILSPLISLLVGNASFLALGLVASLYLFLFAIATSRIIDSNWQGIFSRLKDDEKVRLWLILHSLFTVSGNQIFPLIAFISSVAPIYLTDGVGTFSSTFMFAWIIFLFSLIGLWAVQRLIGMGYSWFCKGSATGVKSLSSFALQYLRNKKERGVEHLHFALLLLKDMMKSEELEFPDLNEAIKAAVCFRAFKSQIPYTEMKKVALELTKFPSIESLPSVLSDFNKNPKVLWTASLKVSEKPRKTLLELIIVIAAVLSGLTFLPESARSALLDILQRLGSAENLQLVMGLFLCAVSLFIIHSVQAYYLSPFEARRFRRQKDH